MRAEPALIVGALATVIVGAVKAAGVDIDQAAVVTILLPLVTAALIRFKVKPA